MTLLSAFAPAKINLYLHITGKRADGYHLLDSLVAFVGVGDRLTLEEAPAFTLEITGPMAGALAHEDPNGNLIARAARLLAEQVGKEPNVKITLNKNLPVASGIGGGSTDAAAALLLLAAHFGLSNDDPLLPRLAAQLGQDVPCCLPKRTCYFRDIGNVTDPGPALPPTPLLLVNPMEALPTPAVYRARQGDFQPQARLDPAPRSTAELIAALSLRTNGLTEAALSLCPAIRTVLDVLAQTKGAKLCRMSGSGASCFALFETPEAAEEAARQISTQHPTWWVAPTQIQP